MAAPQPMNALQSDIGVTNTNPAFKRIRESRQKGNKSVALPTGQIVDQQNQMMQAYINQAHPYNKPIDGVQNPVSNRTQEAGRIRAHSDMKKGQISINAKGHNNLQMVNNSRD